MPRSENRRRFTLWLYDDLALEKEIADFLEGLDRYRRAEVLRNLVKDGWGIMHAPHLRTIDINHHNKPDLIHARAEMPKAASVPDTLVSGAPKASKESIKSEQTSATPPAAVSAQTPVPDTAPAKPMPIETIQVEPQQDQPEVVDPLAALMDLE